MSERYWNQKRKGYARRDPEKREEQSAIIAGHGYITRLPRIDEIESGYMPAQYDLLLFNDDDYTDESELDEYGALAPSDLSDVLANVETIDEALTRYTWRFAGTFTRTYVQD